MTRLHDLPDGFGSTRDTLQHLAAHIVARARTQATGEISLRVTPDDDTKLTTSVISRVTHAACPSHNRFPSR